MQDLPALKLVAGIEAGQPVLNPVEGLLIGPKHIIYCGLIIRCICTIHLSHYDFILAKGNKFYSLHFTLYYVVFVCEIYDGFMLHATQSWYGGTECSHKLASQWGNSCNAARLISFEVMLNPFHTLNVFRKPSILYRCRILSWWSSI